MQREINQNLSGDEVYCTNSLMLLVKTCCVVNFIAQKSSPHSLFISDHRCVRRAGAGGAWKTTSKKTQAFPAVLVQGLGLFKVQVSGIMGIRVQWVGQRV
jgi:hypothetical protein